jgi:hypothetical protein
LNDDIKKKPGCKGKNTRGGIKLDIEHKMWGILQFRNFGIKGILIQEFRDSGIIIIRI